LQRIQILLKSQAISLEESVRSALLDSEPHTDWISIHEFPTRFLERNLEALYARNPHLLEHLSEINLPETVQLRPGGGPLIPCQIRRNYGWTWIHGKDGVAAENRGLIDLALKSYKDPEMDLFCILGFGLGYVASEMLEWFPQKVDPFRHARGMVIFESDPALFLAALTLNDWRGIIERKYVFFCVGDDLKTQWETLCREHLLCSCNKAAFLFGYPVRDAVKKNDYLALAGRVQKTWDEARPLPHQHRSRLLARTHDSKIHKVWTWYNPIERAIPHIASGLMDAMERRGMTCKTLQVESGRYYPPWHKFHDIAGFDPNLIVQLNRPTSLLFPENWAHEIPIPRVVWYVDSPRNFWQKHPAFYFTKHDRVFVWDETYIPFLHECGAEEVHVLPYAADVQPPGEVCERFSCPISFVGQVMDQGDTRMQLTKEERNYLDGIVEEKLSRLEDEFTEILKRNPPPSSVNYEALSEKILVDYYLYVEANSRHRIRVLESLVPYGLRLYGPEAWLTVLPEQSALRDCFCGPVDHRTEFPSLMRSSLINLNIHSLHAVASLNMRDYDVPLQDSFLLTDWVLGADRWFEPERELVFYRSLEDLHARIDEFLSHPEQREPIIQAGKQRVLVDHTYDRRLDDLLDILSRSFAT